MRQSDGNLSKFILRCDAKTIESDAAVLKEGSIDNKGLRRSRAGIVGLCEVVGYIWRKGYSINALIRMSALFQMLFHQYIPFLILLKIDVEYFN